MVKTLTLDPIAEANARAALRHRRARGLRPPPPGIGALAAKLARAALPDKGSALETMKSRWADAVGEKIAKYAAPSKISTSRTGRILVLRVIPAAAPLVQHQQGQILERIALVGAGHFDGLRLIQGPLTDDPVPPARTKRSLSPAELSWLSDSVKEIDSPALRAATISLGKAVLSANEPEPQLVRRVIR
ncbi:MAG: DciA family protein [Pseudomonadota bacterium]